MTTIKLNGKQSKGMELTGDLLTGDTYKMSGYIKKYLDGKWDKVAKGWHINTAKLEAITSTPGTLIQKA